MSQEGGAPAPKGFAAVASGDNTTGHVVAASTAGAALASIASWVLQLLQAPPPPEVTAALGVLFAVLASWVSQRMGDH